ncbi:MAG TPA: tetratricopeptide repeat protein, partial [Thermodesulfovibrionales bacterium]|nr:tetratricopeptide repeat protein [Thermodesulfovibrionales bacterium]
KRLISLFRQLEEKDRLCDELVTLGDYYASQDREKEARSCYTETLQLNPDHRAAQERLAPSRIEPEPEIAPPTGEGGPLDIEIHDLFLQPEETAEASEMEMSAAPEETSPFTGFEQKDLTTVPGEKPFDEIITEIDIFSRYGLLAEAGKLLEDLRIRYPENIDVHTRLKALYMDIQDRERAVTECIVLSKLYRDGGDETRAEQMLKEAGEIDPRDPRLAEYGLAPSSEQPSAAPPAALSLGEAVEGAQPDIEDYEEEIAEADFYARQGLTTEAVKILEKLLGLFPENRNVIGRLNALGKTPSPSDIEEMTGSVGLADTFGIHEPAETPEEFAPPGPAGHSEVIDIGNETEQQESTEITAETGVFGELELEEKTALTAGKQEETAKAPPEEPAPAEISLTGVPSAETEEETFEDFSISESDLVDAQEMPEPSLDSDVLEIFQEFKKGLEKELGDEDAETHYNLGIAYKEMGLVDDAIKEFQTAKDDPKRFLQSSTMLGVCYMEKGLASLAIDVLTKALASLKEKDDSYWALSYELAEAYEKNRNLTEAAGLYMLIYGWNAKFRDVSAKMTLLQSHAPKADGTEKVKEREKPKERKDRVSYL